MAPVVSPRSFVLPIALVVACCLGSVAVLAQAPSPWSDLAIPAGVNPTNVVSIGKLCTYQDAGSLHVHSAFTRRWHTLGVNTPVTVRLTNDCLLVQDGALWTAFASHDGHFRPLSVSPQAQLLNPAGRDNDSILLVLDGNQLHAFSGFVGTWVTRTVSGNLAWSVQRHVAVIADGSVLSGMDAFTGQWHDTAISQPPSFLSTDGTAGLAVGPNQVHGFSALHCTWSLAPALPAATLSRNDDWALFWDSAQMLAYSGIQGRFEYAPVGAIAVPYSDDLFGLADTAFGLVAFSAVRGAFSAPLAPATARVRLNVGVATLVDGLQVHGYSALHNTSATIALASTIEESASSLAYAIDSATGLPHCYSALTGQWYAPPAAALPATPFLATTSALLTTAGGATAFSARTGNFVPLQAPGLTLIGNNTSAVAAAWNQTDLFAFDARTDRWRGIARAATGPLILQIWRTSMFVVDGSMMAGFGAQRGDWATTTMPEPYVIGRANSESARVVTATHVLAHSALSELVAFAQFPEFRRVGAAGTTSRLAVAVDSGGFALFGGGVFAATPTVFAGLGTLLLDPASIATHLVLPVPSEQRAVLDLVIPASPWLIGSEWAFQALVVPASGSPWLTRAATVFVL